MTFADLQNGLYNFVGQGIGIPPAGNLQLIQPSPPLPSGTKDSAVWAYMNEIPPFSLTQNFTPSGGTSSSATTQR